MAGFFGNTKSKGTNLLGKVFGWVIKLALASAGLMVAGDVANVFMSVADEQSVPIMHAMRRQPSVSGWRDNEERKDKYQVTTRYGFGAQRLDTLATIITSSTDFV